MAQILVPGVAQTTISGFNGVQPWACVLHWKYDGLSLNWTQDEISVLASAVFTNWNTFISPQCTGAISMTQVAAVDIGSPSPVASTTTGNSVGSLPQPEPIPSSLCLVVSFRIPARYRGGHPRIYLPAGNSVNLATTSTWAGSFVNTVQTSFQNFVTSVRASLPQNSGAQVSHVVPTYTYTYTQDPVKHKFIKTRTGVKAIYIVASYLGRALPGTQRRRLTTG